MKERPMRFLTEMVQAILYKRKTQTRRIAKLTSGGHLKEVGGHRRWHPSDPNAILACPYGQVGDRLWVQETWSDDCDKHWILYHADMQALRISCGEVFDGCPVQHLNTNPKWKSSIYMPRSAARILLEITGVRLERLQDISEADAIAEGMPCTNPIDAYKKLIDTIYGAGSWDANLWVWVIEFKVVERAA